MKNKTGAAPFSVKAPYDDAAMKNESERSPFNVKAPYDGAGPRKRRRLPPMRPAETATGAAGSLSLNDSQGLRLDAGAATTRRRASPPVIFVTHAPKRMSFWARLMAAIKKLVR